MLEYIILGFLMKAPMSGYAVQRKISVSTSNFYTASFGAIFPALKRLKTKGWIDIADNESTGRKIDYAISEKGKQAFLDWLVKPINPSAGNLEHLLRFFFFHHIKKAEVMVLITDLIRKFQDKGRELDEIETIAREGANEYEMASLEFGREYYKFLIDWYTGFLRKLAKGSVTKDKSIR